MVSELAGTLTKQKIDTSSLREAFFNPVGTPVPVKFGTSGHRGTLGTGFCALHARAIAQAVARIHLEKQITGPVLVGGDTRLMSAEGMPIFFSVLFTSSDAVPAEAKLSPLTANSRRTLFSLIRQQAPPRTTCLPLRKCSFPWR